MHFLLLHHVTSLSAAASTSRASTDCCRGLMSTCVAEIERSKKDTLKIICDGKSFFSASQNCSWQAYLVCHAEDMWAASGGKRSKTSETASFFSFWVNSRRSFTDGQSFQKDGKLYHVYYRWSCCESPECLLFRMSIQKCKNYGVTLFSHKIQNIRAKVFCQEIKLL